MIIIEYNVMHVKALILLITSRLCVIEGCTGNGVKEMKQAGS